MAEELTIKPLGFAVFGVPDACPKCGGRLVPCFGQRIDLDGTRRPVIDPSVGQCEDCRTMFKTKAI